MKKLLIVPFLLILCGCSGIDGRAYYSITPNRNLRKAQTDDWVEDPTEPSFGILRRRKYIKVATNAYCMAGLYSSTRRETHRASC